MNEPFTLFDPNTAECPTPDELLKNIDQLTDDELLTLLDRTQTLAKQLGSVVPALTKTMTDRMKGRNATLLDTEHYTGKLEAGSSIVYDEKTLRTKVTPLLTADGFKKLFVPQPDQLDRRELARLERLGGDIQAAIVATRSRAPGTPKFSYERKPEPEVAPAEPVAAVVEPEAPPAPPKPVEPGDEPF